MFPILPAGSPAAADTSLPAFLVAHDGLYLRKRSLLGVSQTRVNGAEHLPAETEYVEYGLPKVPADQMARVVGFFRSIYRAQRTRSPKLNGAIERANRTHTEEFYEVTDAEATLADLRPVLRAWETTYNSVRPYQALGYLTPAEYLASLGAEVKRR